MKFPKDWTLCEKDDYIEYRHDPSEYSNNYVACILWLPGVGKYEPFLVPVDMKFFPERYRDEDINLLSYFTDWLHPLPEERTLWELEFGMTYVPEDILKLMREANDAHN